MICLQRRKRLIFWRIEERLRQYDIAEQLGISPAHYSNLERGVADPSYDLLLKFKELYNVKDIIALFEKGEGIEWGQ